LSQTGFCPIAKQNAVPGRAHERVSSLTMFIIMVIKIPERDNTKAPANIRQTLSEE
jgi:hypothetical protein